MDLSGMSTTSIIVWSVIVGVLLFFIFRSLFRDEKIEKKRQEDWKKNFENLPDFKPTDSYGTAMSEMTISFDDTRKKICFFNKAQKSFIYDYNKILQCELVVDGETYLKQSTGNTAGRAILGGLLLGGVGAIIGGVTGKSKQNETIRSIDLKIIIDDTINPIFKINFFTGVIQKRTSLYKKVYSEAERWHAIVSGLIRSGNSEK